MGIKKGKLVYSTRSGDERQKETKSNAPQLSKAPAEQSLKVERERKGRRGKTVTVISGFVLTEKDLGKMEKTLKTLCGAGGTSKTEADGNQLVEVQGDHRDKIGDKLTAMGYQVKFVGG